jgi:hypothetical protein
MKDIKNILLVLLTLFLFSCENEDSKKFDAENQSFVRFFLLVDSNNNVLEFPEKDGGLLAKKAYNKDNLKILKIPVAITTGSIENVINISFSTAINGISNYTITPENSLSFTNEKRVDTIYIQLNERWDLSKNPQIKLELTNSSDKNISLGFQNEQISNRELTIGFKETEFNYLFNINRKEIEGVNAENFTFKVLFPNGFIPADIENIALFSEPATFNYTVERKSITKDDEVEFKLTVEENLAEDASLDTFLTLVDIPDYIKGVNDCLQISKPIKVDREGRPSINFYDFYKTSQYYRLFGKYWRYNYNDLICEWRNTSVWPKPVVVDKDNKNGFLYSDNGTPDDELDDIYHHRFKLGFVGNFAPIGTNPFALQNLFEGERNDSPGLTLIEAIEFFPKDGNSTTEGIVNVISQKIILIRRSDLKPFSLPISGSGTYKLINATTNLWKIDLEVLIDATSVNGEIIKRNYILYNNRNFPEPIPLNGPCPRIINL